MEKYETIIPVASALLATLYLNKLLNANLVEVNETVVLLSQLSEKIKKMCNNKQGKN